jgi:tRNA A-37 threonylcarbamoyl transferase component Bud32
VTAVTEQADAACRQEEISNDMLTTMTVEDLKIVGLPLGHAKKVKHEIGALASLSAGEGAAADDGEGGCGAPISGASEILTSPPRQDASPSDEGFLPSAESKKSPYDTHLKATTVFSQHLPSVPLTSLPPLTHVCGSPGASGIVFKIEYQGKDVAVKKFHEHMQDMLRRELKSLQTLAHSRIVRIVAVVTDAQSLPIGFIMEYLPLTLEEAMHRMTLHQSLHVLVEVCIGIAAAHDMKVIHNDIKPANVLCSFDLLEVKLADFGLAHAVTASLSSVSMARGTPLYVARSAASFAGRALMVFAQVHGA